MTAREQLSQLTTDLRELQGYLSLKPRWDVDWDELNKDINVLKDEIEVLLDAIQKEIK